MLEMEMDLEQPTSSVGDDVTIKQEPVEVKTRIIPKQEIEYITVEVEPLVEAEAHLSLKQEIEYISVKEDPPSLLKLEGYDIHGSSQDPLSITTEECSPPEAYLKPSTSSINKTELEEAEGEDAGEDDWEEIKHEGEPTSDVSYPESVILAGDGDNKGTGDGHSSITIEEPYCDNESAVIYQGYCCSICKKIFTQFKDLREHRQVSGHVTQHSCSASQKTFKSNKLTMYSHLHADERPYKKFTRDNVLKLLRVHVGEPQYNCDVCCKRFIYMSHLKLHLSAATDSFFSRCDVCGMIFRNDCAFRAHLKEHTGGGLYSCGICKKTFKHKINLKRHSQTHPVYRPYKTFKQKMDLLQRSQKRNVDRPYICDVCNRICASMGGLNSHSRIHTRQNNPERKVTVDRPYVCDVCNYICYSTSGLKIHSRMMHTEQNNPERTDQGV